MDNIKVNALMLRAVDYLENDKVLTLLSAELGRITAGIKGVKKAGAKLKFAAQPFCFAEYILTQKGGRYTVIQASECESFYELRCDVNKFYAASAVCETAIALTAENEVEGGIFAECVRALTNMCGGAEDEALLSFLLSSLRCAGYGISLAGCSKCNKSLQTEEKLRFDMHGGTFSCWDCAEGVGVSGSTYNALLMASGLPCDLPLAKSGIKRALRLLKEYAIFKTDARFLSLTEYLTLN